MSFLSPQFAFFMAIVFILYWAVPVKLRTGVLLLSSYVFYAFAGPSYLLILVYVTLCAYWFSRTGGGGLLPAVVMLAPLLYFKYSGFLAENINGVLDYFDADGRLDFGNVILPLGISFYTFSALGYVLDCRRGKTESTDLFRLAAGISFFPCLISGPIERQQELIPQMSGERIFDYDEGTMGLKIMAWGYFKKLVIADTLSLTTGEVFSNLQAYTGWPLLVAAFMFSIQIYCDFSGYTDIATGAARLFGIRLMKNFSLPYFSGSIREFWAGWHISLSTWFRDYVYIPLGGNRKGKLRRDLNLLITFLVSGLWHGASWTFVIWGGIHGLLQVGENHLPGGGREKSRGILRILQCILVFILVTAAWVFFKAQTLDDALYVFSNMFAPAPVLDPNSNLSALLDQMNIITISDGFTIIFSLLMLLIFDGASRKGDVFERLKQQPRFLRWAVYVSIGLFTLLLKPEEAAGQFIYFKF